MSNMCPHLVGTFGCFLTGQVFSKPSGYSEGGRVGGFGCEREELSGALGALERRRGTAKLRWERAWTVNTWTERGSTAGHHLRHCTCLQERPCPASHNLLRRESARGSAPCTVRAVFCVIPPPSPITSSVTCVYVLACTHAGTVELYEPRRDHNIFNP